MAELRILFWKEESCYVLCGSQTSPQWSSHQQMDTNLHGVAQLLPPLAGTRDIQFNLEHQIPQARSTRQKITTSCTLWCMTWNLKREKQVITLHFIFLALKPLPIKKKKRICHYEQAHFLIEVHVVGQTPAHSPTALFHLKGKQEQGFKC